MRCPRCRKQRNILAYQRLEDVPEFASDTAPIYKCQRADGGCGWLFAPSDHAQLNALNPKGIPEDLNIV